MQGKRQNRMHCHIDWQKSLCVPMVEYLYNVIEMAYKRDWMKLDETQSAQGSRDSWIDTIYCYHRYIPQRKLNACRLERKLLAGDNKSALLQILSHFPMSMHWHWVPNNMTAGAVWGAGVHIAQPNKCLRARMLSFAAADELQYSTVAHVHDDMVNKALL